MDEKNRCRKARVGFSLTELLIVMGIIVVLIGILIPTVSRVRTAAKEAESKALISQLQAAIEQYYQQYGAYPGPLSNNEIWVGTQPKSPTSELVEPQIFEVNGTTPLPRRLYVTGSENLLLGLMGGLRRYHSGGSPPVTVFDANYVGRGPMSLNDVQPKSGDPLVSGVPISEGRFSDAIMQARDSEIPEILDRFASPMPILYLRAKRGAGGAVITNPQANNNAIVTYGMYRSGGPAYRAGTYHLEHIIGYTGAFTNNSDVPSTSYPPPDTATSIGEGKRLPKVNTSGSPRTLTSLSGPPFHGLGKTTIDPNATANPADPEPTRKYYYPYDPYAYFVNPAMPQPTPANPNVIPTARNKDTYILISAGKDRVYGTDDDITNFGSVSGQ